MNNNPIRAQSWPEFQACVMTLVTLKLVKLGALPTTIEEGQKLQETMNHVWNKFVDARSDSDTQSLANLMVTQYLGDKTPDNTGQSLCE